MEMSDHRFDSCYHRIILNSFANFRCTCLQVICLSRLPFIENLSNARRINTAGRRDATAAAGTKALESRDGHGFTIRLRPSRAEPSQLYVVIELLDHIADTPKALFVAQHPKGLLKHDLPEARGGTVQLLVETESDLVRILQDPGSEVFLL